MDNALFYWMGVSVALVPFWFLILYLSMKIFPCPTELLPEKNNGKRTHKYHSYYNNYPSIFHAIMTVIEALFYACCVGFSHGKPNGIIENLILSVNEIRMNSCAYFIYDTICGELLFKPELAMRIHHFAGISVLASVLYVQEGGNECIGALLLAEVANPFNLYRDILKLRGEENTDRCFQASLTFASLFIITRFIVIPCWIPFLYPGPTHLVVKIFCSILWFVSWHWLFIIINLATKEFKKRQKADEMTIWEKIYSLFFRLRKSKFFLTSYYLIAAYLCFVTLYLSHNSNINSIPIPKSIEIEA